MTTTTVVRTPPAPRSIAAQMISLGALAVALVVVWVVWARGDRSLGSTLWVVLISCGLLLLWGITVMGRELERFVAILVIPLALLVAVVCIFGITVVQPALDRIATGVHDLTHPTVGSVDVSGAVGGFVDKVKKAAGEASK